MNLELERRIRHLGPEMHVVLDRVTILANIEPQNAHQRTFHRFSRTTATAPLQAKAPHQEAATLPATRGGRAVRSRDRLPPRSRHLPADVPRRFTCFRGWTAPAPRLQPAHRTDLRSPFEGIEQRRASSVPGRVARSACLAEGPRAVAWSALPFQPAYRDQAQHDRRARKEVR